MLWCSAVADNPLALAIYTTHIKAFEFIEEEGALSKANGACLLSVLHQMDGTRA